MRLEKKLILGFLVPLSSYLWASSEVMENHYLVRLKDQNLRVQGFQVSSSSDEDQSQLVEVVLNPDQLKQFLKEHSKEIAHMEPVYRVSALPVEGSILGDAFTPDITDQWGLENSLDTDVDIQKAWTYTLGARRIVVAVIDTGVDMTHPELQDHIWLNAKETPGDGIDNDGNGYVDDVRGYDFAGNKPDPSDDNFHGTHCAGVVAGNGVRAYGVAPGVTIMPVKFLDGAGTGSTADAIRAIDYAVANGARILSNSWGGGEESTELRAAIERAGAKGVLFVAAAGNDGKDLNASPTYPAAYKLPNVVSVANITRDGPLHYTSNYGTGFVELAAPGTAILSAYPGNRYASLTGTSMATPFVSGAAALLLSLKPDLSPAELRGYLEGSVKALSPLAQKTTTGGSLSAGNALKALMGDAVPPPQPPRTEDPPAPPRPKPTPEPERPGSERFDPKQVRLDRQVTAQADPTLFVVSMGLKADAGGLRRIQTVTYYYREQDEVLKKLVETPEGGFGMEFITSTPGQKIVIVVKTKGGKYHIIEFP